VTSRILIGAVILAAVGALAWWLQRRPPEAPPRDVYPVPKQLDRTDFPRADATWLVALFSSAACDSCRGLGPKLKPLESYDVAVCEVGAEDQLAVHLGVRFHFSCDPDYSVEELKKTFAHVIIATGSSPAWMLMSVMEAGR
jgi:hypothetical protein